MADQMIGSPTKLASSSTGSMRPRAIRGHARTQRCWPLRSSTTRRSRKSPPPIALLDGAVSPRQFNFDAQSVRPYFPYAQVQAVSSPPPRGSSTSSSSRWRACVPGIPPSPPSMSTMAETRLGRIYLDMHPRDGKDKWFSTAAARSRDSRPAAARGHAGLQLLRRHRRRSRPMQYSDVVMFFHEFGHLMHHILGSQGEWAAQAASTSKAISSKRRRRCSKRCSMTTACSVLRASTTRPARCCPRSFMRDERAPTPTAARSWLAAPADVHGDLARLPQPAAGDAGLRCALPAGLRALQHASRSCRAITLGHLHAPERLRSNYYTYVLDKVIALDFFAQFDAQTCSTAPPPCATGAPCWRRARPSPPPNW